jgi:hypothetical protein
LRYRVLEFLVAFYGAPLDATRQFAGLLLPNNVPVNQQNPL